MEQKRNLCAQIPISLHSQVREEQAQTGKSLGEYIEMILTEYYNMKKGGTNMANGKTRTLAFQVSEELFQKVKDYLADHHGMSQKDFVVGLIEQAIAEWEMEQAPAQPTGQDAPCDIPEDEAPAAEAPQEETDTEGSDEADSQDEDNEVA